MNLTKTTIFNLLKQEFFARHLICMQRGMWAEFSAFPPGLAMRRARQSQPTAASFPTEAERVENGQLCVKNKQRFTNLLLLVKRQSVLYNFGAKSLTVPAGGLALVPKGASYSCTELQGVGYLFAEFDLFCENGEELCFGTEPVLLFQSCPESIAQEFEQLYRAFAGESFKSAMYCNTLLYRILIQIANEGGRIKQNRAEQAVNLCMDYLKRHCCEPVETEQLCRLCGLCPTQLRLYFKKYAGCTITDYKNRRRIEQARQQLLQTNLPIGKIAETLGFENAFYFSRVFKIYTGASPRAYRAAGGQQG